MNGIAKWGFTLIVRGREVFTIILWHKREYSESEDRVPAEANTSRRVLGFRGGKAA